MRWGAQSKKKYLVKNVKWCVCGNFNDDTIEFLSRSFTASSFPRVLAMLVRRQTGGGGKTFVQQEPPFVFVVDADGTMSEEPMICLMQTDVV